VANKKEVKKGDKVKVIIEVWRDDETPTIRNFYSGKIVEIIERTEECFYVRIADLDRLVPIDQVNSF
jgi:ribosomal protein L21E